MNFRVVLSVDRDGLETAAAVHVPPAKVGEVVTSLIRSAARKGLDLSIATVTVEPA